MPQSQSAAVLAAVDYIESHLTGKLTLHTLAAGVHCSPYHLHRAFTRTVGLTPHSYIQRRQLTQAAKALTATSHPIAQLALLSGYDSQQSFTTAFHALYKQTPGAYRRLGTFYPLELPFSPAPGPGGWEASWAAGTDLPPWMTFLRAVVGGFPCLRPEEHLSQLRQAVLERQAVVLRQGGGIVGAAVFSPAEGSIGFLAVHPQRRREGAAAELLSFLLRRCLPPGPVSVTTFRRGDRADNGQRRDYLDLGFAEGPLLREFGYPTQRLLLSPERREALYGPPL